MTFILAETEQGNDWVGFLSVVASVVTACATLGLVIAAFLALDTWRRQISVQRKLEYMDRLSASVDELVNLLTPAVQLAKWIPQTIDLYENSLQLQSSDTPHKIPAYLKDRGKDDSEMLERYLSPCANPAISMQSLLKTVQAMKLKDFNNCFNACRRILWVYERLSSVQGVLRGNLNWHNPEVQTMLTKILNIDAEELAQQMNGAESHLTEFLVANYAAMGLDR